MKVIIITDEQIDELIAVTKDMKSAIKYLIENKWIEKDDRYLVRYHMVSITEKFGEDWEDTISNISRKEFNAFFGRYIYLDEEEVYE